MSESGEEPDVNWFQKGETDDMSEDRKPDLRHIQAIRSEDNLFRLIVSSLCPQIYGQHLVKSGLVLALFGGVRKEDRQSKGLSVRSEINVLLIGDHGSNKDLLLKAVHWMAPNPHYICGNTSNRNCLTTSLKKSRSDKHFEKGCLESKELAICCFDEFERMDVTQHQVIEEVMEYQTITYFSEGIHREVSANTAIIAAVNPLNGCYDWSLNVWQNTKLKKSLLSKFDLIFVLVDSPDKEMDIRLTNEILESRKRQNYGQTLQSSSSVAPTVSSQPFDCQLMAKLYVGPNEKLNVISADSLKQYISYSQKNVNPVLNREAVETLKSFYTEFERSLINKSETRDIESLYRLTEARARIELRSEATKEDVLDVIDIVRHSFGKNYKTPNLVHSLNFRVSFKSSKKSQNPKNLLKALKLISEQKQQKVFSFNEIVEICGQFEIPFESKDEIWGAVEKLNEQSFLLKKSPNSYELID